MKGNQIDGQPVTEEQLLKEGYRKYTGKELISFIIKIFVNILVIVFVPSLAVQINYLGSKKRAVLKLLCNAQQQFLAQFG